MLQQRLKEAEDTLQAIREGGVDALIVETGEGDQVFTLRSADYPYRLIIDNMIQGAVIFDDAGIIFYANATFARMVNHSHQELFGYSLDSFIDEEDREFFRTLTSSHSHSAGGTGTIRLVPKDRHDLAVFVGLVSIKIDNQYLHCAILTDLTEQKKYDRALVEEKFSRMILEQTGEAVVVCEPSGRIIRSSRATDRLVQQSTLHTWFHEKFKFLPSITGMAACGSESWSAGRNVIEDVIGGRTLHGLEVTLQVANRTVPLLLSGRPLLDEHENTIGAIITMVDITEQKQAEQALKDLNDSLEQRIVNRTRDLLSYQKHLREMTSELVVTEQRERRRLANELHDYLAQLIVVCRMKLAQLNRAGWTPELKTNIEDIDKILTDSLEYTRTLIAELSPSILYELGIVPALFWLGGQFERHNLHVDVREEDKDISLPEDHAIFVFQAVRELLFNILKHADTKHATISLKKTAPHELQVKVKDAGRGFHISSESQDFARPGKFGLFSIRERVEALGGEIQIEAKQGEGTCITLHVPYDSFPPSELSDSRSGNLIFMGSSSSTTAREKGIRILLVDDHALVRQGMRGLLEVQPDFLVVGEAQNGLEAIESTRTLHPDIIVMDVNMPKMNGIEATRNIVREFPSMPIIGLSVQEDKHVQGLMLEAGASLYLTKNGIASQLVDGIRRLVLSSP
ncbi:response regulator [Candidatus Nitrospira neomarina]|uniref:Response regulator n=1 Tax=Candidatus Nitrospira neomarina TaxID=3020899 RepID=A0AA96K545_9BACT|nr:response regulator [Candidatus Nitrospira neomarina]WNM64064.1 response regulator [Candidatus Nitrospira neomarina]